MVANGTNTRLTLQGAVLCIGDSVCKRHGCDVHKWPFTRTAVHDECRHSNTSCSRGGYRGIFTQDGGIVGNGGRYRFPHRPHWMLAHPIKLVGGHPQQHHKEPYRIASATCRKQFLELPSEFLPGLAGIVVVVVGRLVHREFLDLVTELDCCLHRQCRAGGDTEHERRSTRFVDEGFDVFNFTLNRIRLRISAVASSPTIIVEHGEVLRQ